MVGGWVVINKTRTCVLHTRDAHLYNINAFNKDHAPPMVHIFTCLSSIHGCEAQYLRNFDQFYV